jgi:hypothetical protein
MVTGEAADVFVGTPKGRVPLSWEAVGLLLDNSLYERGGELALTREAFATAIGASTIALPESERERFAETLGAWLVGLSPEQRSSLELIELEQLRTALDP